MKLQTNNNMYKSENWSLKISKDMPQIEAWSYEWWQFVKVDKIGNIFFNDYRYSVSTSQHQRNVEDIFRRLGIKPDFYLNTRNSLSGYKGIENGIIDQIAELKYNIRETIKDIRKKGTHKTKNEERRDWIRDSLKKIARLRDIKNNYLNKKRPKHYKNSLKGKASDLSGEEYQFFASHFIKNSGKLDVINFLDFLYKRSYSGDFKYFIAMSDYYDNPSFFNTSRYTRSKNKLKSFFGIRDLSHAKTFLLYRYTKDLGEMLPEIDTKEYEQLVKWTKTQHINRKTLNTFLLDKMRTYLVNKQNRKIHSPKEALQFKVRDELKALKARLDANHLKIIETDKELRAEGRTQSHCIGSKHYVESCLRGYQALHYKGYTFYFTPDLHLQQTTGKHNSQTPLKIQNEVLEALKEVQNNELKKGA